MRNSGEIAAQSFNYGDEGYVYVEQHQIVIGAIRKRILESCGFVSNRTTIPHSSFLIPH